MLNTKPIGVQGVGGLFDSFGSIAGAVGQDVGSVLNGQSSAGDIVGSVWNTIGNSVWDVLTPDTTTTDTTATAGTTTGNKPASSGGSSSGAVLAIAAFAAFILLSRKR